MFVMRVNAFSPVKADEAERRGVALRRSCQHSVPRRHALPPVRCEQARDARILDLSVRVTELSEAHENRALSPGNTETC